MSTQGVNQSAVNSVDESLNLANAVNSVDSSDNSEIKSLNYANAVNANAVNSVNSSDNSEIKPLNYANAVNSVNSSDNSEIKPLNYANAVNANAVNLVERLTGLKIDSDPETPSNEFDTLPDNFQQRDYKATVEGYEIYLTHGYICIKNSNNKYRVFKTYLPGPVYGPETSFKCLVLEYLMIFFTKKCVMGHISGDRPLGKSPTMRYYVNTYDLTEKLRDENDERDRIVTFRVSSLGMLYTDYVIYINDQTGKQHVLPGIAAYHYNNPIHVGDIDDNGNFTRTESRQIDHTKELQATLLAVKKLIIDRSQGGHTTVWEDPFIHKHWKDYVKMNGDTNFDPENFEKYKMSL
jgi:hypothetical protein